MWRAGTPANAKASALGLNVLRTWAFGERPADGNPNTPALQTAAGVYDENMFKGAPFISGAHTAAACICAACDAPLVTCERTPDAATVVHVQHSTASSSRPASAACASFWP